LPFEEDVNGWVPDSSTVEELLRIRNSGNNPDNIKYLDQIESNLIRWKTYSSTATETIEHIRAPSRRLRRS